MGRVGGYVGAYVFFVVALSLKEVFSGSILLRRMAFAIFSGEVDQYVKYLPDIQGMCSCPCTYVRTCVHTCSCM